MATKHRPEKGLKDLLEWNDALKEKWKVEPCPRTLSTVISPPINLASLLEIANPSPVPPYFLVVEESNCVNTTNSLEIASFSIPMPVSLTEKVNVPSESDV